VVEGWTFQQLRQALAAHPKIAQTLREASDAEIMARLDRPGEHPEGGFSRIPIIFPLDFTDEAFLRRALTAMDRRLNEVWSSPRRRFAAERSISGTDSGIDCREGNRTAGGTAGHCRACSRGACKKGCRCKPIRR
jgi:hypothetical protein